MSEWIFNEVPKHSRYVLAAFKLADWAAATVREDYCVELITFKNGKWDKRRPENADPICWMEIPPVPQMQK
jgi:hypothetical protein